MMNEQKNETLTEIARQAANAIVNAGDNFTSEQVADAVTLAVLQEIANAPYYEVNGDTKLMILKAIQELQK